MHRAHGEQTLGGGPQPCELVEDHALAFRDAEAVDGEAVQTAAPRGEARDLAVAAAEALGEHHTERPVGPHRGREAVHLPERLFGEQVELGDGEVAERLDGLVLQRRRQRIDRDIAQRRERHRADDRLGGVPRAIGAAHDRSGRARFDPCDTLILQQVTLEPAGHGDRQVLVATLAGTQQQLRRRRAAVHGLPVVGESLLQQRDIARGGAIGDVGVVAETYLRVGRALRREEIMHGDVMLCVCGVVPVRQIFEGHVLLEDRSGPTPRRQLARITCERVAWMRRPVRKRYMFTADEKCLTGAVPGRLRREVHDFDAVALRRGERTAVGVRYSVAARFGMAW